MGERFERLERFGRNAERFAGNDWNGERNAERFARNDWNGERNAERFARNDWNGERNAERFARNDSNGERNAERFAQNNFSGVVVRFRVCIFRCIPCTLYTCKVGQLRHFYCAFKSMYLNYYTPISFILIFKYQK